MIILSFFIIALVIATFLKPSYGLMVYIVMRTCIPPTARFLGFSINTFALALFMLFAMRTLLDNLKKVNPIQKDYVKNIRNYILIILALSIISSLTAIVPFPYQISHLLQFIYTELLPSILYILIFFNKKDFVLLNYVLGIAIILSSSYTIYTFFTQSNPLFEIFSTVKEDLIDYAEAGKSRMLIGAGAGIMNNKITTALMSLLFFSYFWGKNIVNKVFLSIVLTSSFISVVLTTQRTSLICVFIFLFLTFFCTKKKIKFILTSIFVVVLLYVLVVNYFPDFEDLGTVFAAAIFIWSDKVQSDLNVSGSSLEMRFTQLKAVFEITNIHIFEGLGYSYCTYFSDVLKLSESRIGQDLYGFESVIFKIITSSGFIGLVAFFKLIKKIIKLMTTKMSSSFNYFFIFSLTYLLAIIMTDDSGTMFLFLIFSVLNIIYNQLYINDHTLTTECKVL